MSLHEKYKVILFDLDGVVWLGDTPIATAVESICKLKELGKTLRFVTNNASSKRETYYKKFKAFGIPIEINEVINAGFAAAWYLEKKEGNKKVHILGTEELKLQFSEFGHEIVDRGAEYVATGLDNKLTYDRLDLALQNIIEDKALFFACNSDNTYIDDSGFHPGGGSVVAALAACCGKGPDLQTGKPNREIFEAALSGLEVDPKDCLMIGDKLETDILGGNNFGMDTALVLTGTDTQEDCDNSEIKPTYIFEDLKELL